MNLRSEEILNWLQVERSGESPYVHVHLNTSIEDEELGLTALAEIAKEAHALMVKRLEEFESPSLDPYGRELSDQQKLSMLYPASLHDTTLLGYLGELMAGVFAENFDPHGGGWEVPVFLFRSHEHAVHLLNAILIEGASARPVPGRPGSDCLVFHRDADGSIDGVIVCEAKCLSSHHSSKVNDGHSQLSRTNGVVPLDLVQLVEALQAEGLPESNEWIGALRELQLGSITVTRHDMFVYICGQAPKQNPTWISRTAKNARHVSQASLEVHELILENLSEVVSVVYRGGADNQ